MYLTSKKEKIQAIMKTLLIIIFVLSFGGNLFCAHWVEPMVVNPDSISNWFPDLAMAWDSTGRTFVSWVSDTFLYPYGGNVIKACYFNGISWSNPQNVCNDSFTEGNSGNVMSTDSNGIAWLFWYHGSYPVDQIRNNEQWGWGIKYSCFINGSWTEPCLAESAIGAFVTDAKTDESGKIWVVWSEGYLYFASYTLHYDGNNWFKESLNTGANWILGPFFAVDPASIHATWGYVTFPYSDTNQYGIIYAYNSGQGWEGYEGIVGDSISDFCPSMAFDTTDQLWIVWSHSIDENSNIYAKYRKSGIWSSIKMVTSDTTDEYSPRIHTDGFGRTWLSYHSNRDGNYHIYVTYIQDTSFTIPQKISIQNGINSQLKNDIFGNIWAIWYDNYKVYASYYRMDTIPPQISVVYPNGGEIFNFEDTVPIIWHATDEDTIVWVNIYLSVDGGNSFDLVSEFETNDSLYEWIIPDVYSDCCLMRITAIDKGYNAISDESDSFFTILGTSIEEEKEREEKRSVSEFHLYPNLCRERAIIELKFDQTIRRKKEISLKIYDISGREIYSFLPSDNHNGTLIWNGVDNAGKPVSPGVYLCRMKAGEKTQTLKFVYMR
jgi:hypothetical protein